MSPLEILSILRNKILEEVRNLLDSEELKIYEASEHLIEADGKLLRPTLVLLGCQSVGGRIDQALPTAAGIELAHVASLIHDDIMDSSGTRRSVQAVHLKYGVPTAIIAGDLLLIKLFQAIAKNAHVDGVTDRQIIRALEVASEACISVCEGQCMDLDFTSRWDVTEEECLQMYERKTATAFSASLVIGAILGGGNEEEIRALSEFGKLLGVAFQIQDDYLGCFGTEEKLGKPLASDLKKGKRTLMIVHALQNLEGDARDTLTSLLGKNLSDTQVAKVVKILKESGSVEYVKKKMLKLVLQAKSELTALRDTRTRKILLDMADFIHQGSDDYQDK